MASIIGSEETIFVDLDVGTTKVATLVGQLDSERNLRVIGAGVAPATGMRKGGVVSLEAVAQALQSLNF